MTTGLRHIATEPANLSNKYFSMEKKRSPLPRNKIKSVPGAAASDSVSTKTTYKCCKVFCVSSLLFNGIVQYNFMLFKFGWRAEVAKNVVLPPNTFVYIQLLNNISNTDLLMSVLRAMFQLHVLELYVEVSSHATDSRHLIHLLLIKWRVQAS